VIAYPAGQEPDFWDPIPSDHRHRFALGRIDGSSRGAPPLVAVGMNPSHARESESDRTVNRLIEVAGRHGYTGWLMLNLYPERSPRPSALSEYDAALSIANCNAIERVLLRCGTTEVLGAWGNMPHRTLKRARVDVQALLSRMGVRLFTFDPLTLLGNPRHPHPPGRPLPMLGPKKYLT
jgi:hypothetical protein